MSWIRVKDREPEKGQHVLVYCGTVTGEIYYNVNEPSITKVEWNTPDYSELIDIDYYQVFAGDITHWMPLPEIPKD